MADNNVQVVDSVHVQVVDSSHSGRGFVQLYDMREKGEFVDIVLVVGGLKIPAHRLVLAAVSPYFRTMFRDWEAAAGDDQPTKEVELMGLEGDSVETLVRFCYTGGLCISLDSVSWLLSAADLLLLDWPREECGKFLVDNLHMDNVVIAGRLAKMYQLTALQAAVVRFCESEFCRLSTSDEWVELSCDEVSELLTSDGLVAPEDRVCDSVIRWVEARCPNPQDHRLLDPGCLDPQNQQFLDEAGRDPDDLQHLVAACPEDRQLLYQKLLSLVRFPLCSRPYLDKLATDPSLGFQSFAPLMAESSVTDHLGRGVRCRGTNHLLVSCHDAGTGLWVYNPDGAKWQPLADLPPDGGAEYAALASHGSRVYLVGGRSKDGRSLRSVHSLDLETGEWERGPDMTEVRWYHGATVIGDSLYAVAGCGLLDSIEVLSLKGEGPRQWKLLPSMAVARHLPGVGHLDGKIYVVGGTDDNWEAFDTVEVFNPENNEWRRLPNMDVPRVQPGVVGLGGKLYVLGGRNSKKAELKSVECYDPELGVWMRRKEMHQKRWGPGAVVFHERILAVGGRGKRAGPTAEVYSEMHNSWTVMAGDLPCHDRCYETVLVQKPWKWTFK